MGEKMRRRRSYGSFGSYFKLWGSYVGLFLALPVAAFFGIALLWSSHSGSIIDNSCMSFLGFILDFVNCSVPIWPLLILITGFLVGGFIHSRLEK